MHAGSYVCSVEGRLLARLDACIGTKPADDRLFLKYSFLWNSESEMKRNHLKAALRRWRTAEPNGGKLLQLSGRIVML